MNIDEAKLNELLGKVVRDVGAMSAALAVPGVFHVTAAMWHGEEKMTENFRTGFTRFRRATQTPFNLILEARP